jgi:hypothetical protein
VNIKKFLKIKLTNIDLGIKIREKRKSNFIEIKRMYENLLIKT